MSCEWAWYSWQDAGNFGEVLAGSAAVVAGALAVREYLKRGADERKRQATCIEIIALDSATVQAVNHSDRGVTRTAWIFPSRPEGERRVWIYHVARHTHVGRIQTDRNAIAGGSREEHVLEEGESVEDCYLIFRDVAQRWWRAGIDGTLSKYKPSEEELAGPRPEDAPSERARAEREQTVGEANRPS